MISEILATVERTGCKWGEVCRCCNGEGKIDTGGDYMLPPVMETCPTCKGVGFIKEDKEVSDG